MSFIKALLGNYANQHQSHSLKKQDTSMMTEMVTSVRSMPSSTILLVSVIIILIILFIVTLYLIMRLESLQIKVEAPQFRWA